MAHAKQVFVRRRPRRDRGICWRPVSVGSFITPFHKPWHDLCMWSGAAKSFHSPFALPDGQGPERAMSVYEEAPTEKPRCAHDLALTEEGLPHECRNVLHRSNAKASD